MKNLLPIKTKQGIVRQQIEDKSGILPTLHVLVDYLKKYFS
jgi:hypothetical protein